MPVIPDGFPNKEAIDAETLANAHLIAAAPDLLAVNTSWEVQEKDDGIWLVLHGNGTTGKGAFRLADANSNLIAVQVLRHLESDRKSAIAKVKGGAA